MQIRRRAFAALAAGLAAGSARARSENSDVHRQFLRDLARSYETQQVAVDFDDVTAVLAGMPSARLGIGTAAGPDAAEMAANAALREAGMEARHALVLLAFAPGEARLSAYRAALDAMRPALHPDTMLVYGGCCDERLHAGHVRVSLMVG